MFQGAAAEGDLAAADLDKMPMPGLQPAQQSSAATGADSLVSQFFDAVMYSAVPRVVAVLLSMRLSTQQLCRHSPVLDSSVMWQAPGCNWRRRGAAAAGRQVADEVQEGWEEAIAAVLVCTLSPCNYVD